MNKPNGKEKNRIVPLGFSYRSCRAHKAFRPTATKNRGSFFPSSASAIPAKFGRSVTDDRWRMGQGPSPGQGGSYLGRREDGMSPEPTICGGVGQWWRRSRWWSGRRVVGAALRTREGWHGLGKLEIAAAGPEGVRRQPMMMSCSQRKVECSVGGFVGGQRPDSLRT
jgi:hypothetical protein